MASKTFLLLALAFAVVLLVSSQVSAAKEASSHDSTNFGTDGRGGYNMPKGDAYKTGGHTGGNYCRYGCCGGGRYNKGCRCCSSLAEATAYKQAQVQN